MKEKKKKNKLLENIESIAIAVALAFAIRYFVIEAFKIPTGSMATTLLGEHKNIYCPNCSWFYYADRQSHTATCPNCQYTINVSTYCDSCNGRIKYNWPAWLWRKGTCRKCQTPVPWNNLSNRINHGGNRILVNKFWYKFTKPERWDIVVFVYPLYDLTCKNCSVQLPDAAWNSNFRCPQCGSMKFSKKKKNYIKRLIGLPGEKLHIVNGDIYINDVIQKKPPTVQDTLWLPVYNSRYEMKEETGKTWIADDNNAWKIDRKSLNLNNAHEDSRETSLVTFGHKISDQNGYNNTGGSNEMGDVKMCFDVTLQNNSHSLTLILEKNKDIFTAVLPSNEHEKKSLLMKNNKVIQEKDVRLKAGQIHRIEFSNVDRVVSLSIDNTKVFTYDYDDGLKPDPIPFETSAIRFGGVHANARFENIEIFHDIYYTNLSETTWGTNQPVQLGEKDYFMLGDNSRNSNDSRIWKFVPEKNIVGKAFFVFWPLNNIRFIK